MFILLPFYCDTLSVSIMPIFWNYEECSLLGYEVLFLICNFNVPISQEFFLHMGWVKSSYNTCGKWRKALFHCTLPWHPASVIWHAVNLVLDIRELMDAISRPVNVCDVLPNYSHCLGSTAAELLATNELTPSLGTDQRHKDSCLESRRAVQNFLLPPCRKVSYKSCHLA